MRLSSPIRSSGRDSIDHDSFTYAAATSAGVSAAATIDIAITDDPPIFAVPGTVDFGEVIIGSSARREIRIENRGSGTLSGTLETDKPWSHEAGEYRLSGGARRDMWVEFAPDKEGKFTGQARFPGQPERFTDLQGTGKAPFSVFPPQLQLTVDEASRVRSGSFTVTNQTGAEKAVGVKLPGRLAGVKELLLAANARMLVTVTTKAEDLAALDEPIHLSTRGYGLDLEARAPVVKAILRTTPEALSFSETSAGDKAEAVLVVENVGGENAPVHLAAAAPFSIAADDQSFVLPPGQSKSAKVTFESREPGNYRDWVIVRTADEETRVSAAGVSSAAGTSALPFKEATAVTEEAESGQPVSTASPVKQVRLINVSGNSCELAWDVPGGSVAGYEARMRSLSLDAERNLRIDWVPLKKVSFSKSKGEARARIKGLEDGRRYTLRIIALDTLGRPADPSPDFVFTTKEGSWPHVTLMQALLLALGALAFGIARERFFPRR